MTTSPSASIESLREIPKSKSKAAHALVGAYDAACQVVKMLPARVATIEVECVDEKSVTLRDVTPIMALEMMDTLIEDEDITKICLTISTEEVVS